MTPASAPRVAVVVLNWNGLELTRACVRSLLAQTRPAVAIVVVDNGSANGEATALRAEFERAIEVLALPHNLGFAAGCNAAFTMLFATDRCDAIALCNNDAEADPRWLEALVAVLQQDPRIGIVGSRMRLFADPERLDGAGVWILGSGDSMPRGRGDRAAAWAREEDVLSTCGGALLLRTSMLRAIGPFRADFFANFEDEDLCLRAAVAGWRIRYAPAAEVRHHLNATIARVRDLAFDVRSVRNATWAWAVNLPWPVLLLNLPWFLLANLGVVVAMPLCGRPRIAAAFVRGRLRALRELPAILRERRRLRPLRAASWWHIWRMQKSFVLGAWSALRAQGRRRNSGMLGGDTARGVS